MILKILVGFLLGFLSGAGGTVFLLTSGAGNYIIAANPRVQSMESKIRELEDERTFLGRRLEEVADRNGDMAKRFEELVDRFEALQDARVRELEEAVRRATATRKTGEAKPVKGTTAKKAVGEKQPAPATATKKPEPAPTTKKPDPAAAKQPAAAAATPVRPQAGKPKPAARPGT